MLPNGEAYPDKDLEVDCCFARSLDTSGAERTASLLHDACDPTTICLDIMQNGQAVNGAPLRSKFHLRMGPWGQRHEPSLVE
jgi:hypothetical protein